ncbi:MAG: hypothetical protein Q8O46_03335 [bacterium]|nr:hypothetical protein [bacterium]
MIRFITPIILVIIAIGGFLLFVGPSYGDISSLKEQMSSYREALDNAKTLESERDKLTTKYNTVDPDNLKKIEKLLPDSVDNIRLILEIEKIALSYGMLLKDVRYDIMRKSDVPKDSAIVQSGEISSEINKDYGTWDLSFSIQGTYDNFVNFLKDLERNLRIVDVSSIQFTSDSGSEANPNFAEVYRYAFKIKTYWLKN